MDYEVVIGLECHVQLQTESKLFSGSATTFGSEPNAHIDPVSFGLPGCLPVLNQRVVEFAIMLGLAVNCEIRKLSRFARKHYFYPDLPKGYQISQYEEPICERGHLRVPVQDSERTVGIRRIHIEEDAGKNIHCPDRAHSLVDLNRAGVPLLEVVTEPDIRSPAEAGAYLRTLRQVVRYLGIGDGNMEEGSLRCDANISLREVGDLKFGTRTEIKNLNSFRFVEKALAYEAARQMALLKKGGAVVQETLLFDSDTGTTRSMRGKEESADYRYFPDPDLPPIHVTDSWIAEISTSIPELPQQRTQRFIDVYGLNDYDAGVLTAEPEYADYFEEVFEVSQNAKAAANWITSELFGALNRHERVFKDCPIAAQQLGDLIKLIDSDTISGKIAKQVFADMFESGKDPEEIVRTQGLEQITDEGAITEIVLKVLEQNKEQVASYLGGNEKVLGFLVGQVMKASQGSAKPKLVNKILKREIDAQR